jgi:hypothetical protein
LHAKIHGKSRFPPSSAAQLLDAIKGSVNRGGQRIFLEPGGRWYERITMEARNAGRWFCIATEAIASGRRETRRWRIITAFDSLR